MVAEIILIPNDPKFPDSAKQCAQYIARSLSAIGIKAREQVTLCTGKNELQKAVATALGRSNVVVLLGGLSAEQNYLAKHVIAKGLKLPLETSRQCLESIRSYCERTGEFYQPEDERLAEIPKGAAVFPGQYGKIPGMAISSSRQHILLLPDNQTEAAAMLPQYIIPYLGGSEAQTNITRTVRTYGIGAEQARAILCELLDTANPAVTLEREGSDLLVRVSAHAASSAEAASLCTPVLRTVVERLGDAAYGLDVDSLQTAVVQKLTKKQLGIAVAESGCDGIFTRVLSETPGGAAVLRYSKAADDDATKQNKLNVSGKLLKRKGGVSEEVAVAMAAGARKRANTDLGVAITVGADPNKKKSGKDQFGLVYIAVCDANNVYVKKLVVGSGDPRERDGIVDAALSRALNMLRLFVDYLPGVYPGAISLEEALAGKTVTHADKGAEDGSSGKKPGFGGRLLENFIIRKADEPRDKVRKFIFILAVLVFLGSAGYVGNYYYESWKASKQRDQYTQLYSYGEDGDVEISEDFPEDFLAQFAALWSINPDVVGYLSIEGTELQYPVVQASNNDYYLRRDFYEKSNQYGIPFMDYRVNVSRPSDNMVIYGHNMRTAYNKEDYQMFGELVRYRDLNYYTQHPVIDFSTVYSQDKYKIISIFITNAYEAQGAPLFDYHNFIDASSDEAFMDYVEQVKLRSMINTGVDVEATDKLLTLSTCEYDFTEARLVVVARRVRNGESATVDVSKAEKNPNPLYPAAWYQVYGGTMPDVGSATIVTEPAVNRPPESPASAQESEVASTSASQSASSQSEAVQGSEADVLQFYRESESEGFQAESEASASSPAESVEETSSRSEPESQPEPESQSDDGGDEPTLFDFISTGNGTEPADGTGRYFANTGWILPEEGKVDDLAGQPSLFDFLEDPPNKDSGGSRSQGGSGNYVSTLTVNINGARTTLDTEELIGRIVQVEMGSSFHEEALKAQAVAAYSYVLYHNNKGQVPNVLVSTPGEVTTKVKNAVSKVLGDTVVYQGKEAFTPYHATSAGQTTSSAAVWGGAYDYLVSVESPLDKKTTNYKVTRTYTSDYVSDVLYEKLGIQTWGDPEDWFEILSYNTGGYVGRMSICGETTSQNTGNTITGRLFRESVMNLRSHYFKISYDYSADTFTFTTYGYGHGVGMSQNGANLYAQEGWDYIRILEHYFPGTRVQ